eukprot:1888822-Rhodomonas_salina.1
MRSRALGLECQLQEVEAKRRSAEEENRELRARLLALEGRVDALEKEREVSKGELESVRRAEQEAAASATREATRARTAEEELAKARTQAATLTSLVEKGSVSIRSLETEVTMLREGRGRDMHALAKCRAMLDESSEAVRHLHGLVMGEGSLEWQLHNLFHRLGLVIKEKSLLEDQVMAVNLQLDTLTQEVARLQSSRREREAEVARLMSRTTFLESENGTISLEVQRLAKENGDAMGRIRELQSMLQVARESSTHDVQTHIAAFERLRKDHAGLQAKFEELDTDHCKLQGMHKADAASLRERTNALDLSQQHVSKLQRDVERLDASLHDMNTREKEQKLEVERRDRRNTEQTAALQLTIQSMKMANTKDVETIDALRSQLREAESAHIAAKTAGELSTEKIAGLQRTVQSMQVEQREQVDTIMQLRSELQDTIGQLRSELQNSELALNSTKLEADRERQQSEDHNASLQRTILSMQAVHQDNVHTIEILRKELHTAEAANSAANIEVERLKFRHAQLEIDAESAQQARCSVEGMLAVLQQELDNAKRGRAELEGKIAELLKELAAEKEGHQQIETQLASVRQELDYASREQQRLLSERERDAAALKELQTKFLKSEQRFSEVETENGDLKRRLKASELKAEALEKEKEYIQTEVEGLKKRLEDSEATRKDVEERLEIATQELKTSLTHAMDAKA